MCACLCQVYLLCHALVVWNFTVSLCGWVWLYLNIIIAISAVRSQGLSIYAIYYMNYWAVWIEIIISTCRWPIIVLATIFSRFVMMHAQFFFFVFVISFSRIVVDIDFEPEFSRTLTVIIGFIRCGLASPSGFALFFLNQNFNFDYHPWNRFFSLVIRFYPIQSD